MLMVKKTSFNSKKHIQRNDTHWVIRRSILSYAVLVFFLFATLSMSAFLIDRLVVNKHNTTRYNDISAIYDGLKLGPEYREISSNIFGEKRTYTSDKNRSYASSITYGHNDTPANTSAELKKRAEASGFTYLQTSHEGTANPVMEFKNKDDQWLRIAVTSKSTQDTYMYGLPAGDPASDHSNEAPSHVSIKVNLDSNND